MFERDVAALCQRLCHSMCTWHVPYNGVNDILKVGRTHAINCGYSRSKYELENKLVIHTGWCYCCVDLVELFVEFDCCDNCSRVQ